MGRMLRKHEPNENQNPDCLSAFAHDAYYGLRTHLLKGGGLEKISISQTNFANFSRNYLL